MMTSYLHQFKEKQQSSNSLSKLSHHFSSIERSLQELDNHKYKQFRSVDKLFKDLNKAD